jgi:hypothetical protein
MIVQLERRRFCFVQDNEFFTQNFNFTCRHLCISRALRTITHQTFQFNNIFITNTISQFKAFFTIWIKDDLSNALTVAYIQKDHATMVTTAMHPPRQRNFFTDMLFSQIAAIMAAHSSLFLSVTGHDIN